MQYRAIVITAVFVFAGACGSSDRQQAEDAQRKLEQGAEQMKQAAEQIAKGAQQSSAEMARYI